MPETDPELAAVLDAVYREFVRSLHKDTIAAVSRVDDWWNHQCFRVVISGMSGGADEADVNRIDREWRAEIIPTLLPLINGHPDPAVRDAADYLNTRLVSVMLIAHRRPDDPRHPDDDEIQTPEVDRFTVHLIHDGLTRLRRAAYHAPFRVHRPEADWDGVPIGNSEGMPHDILARMKERAEHYEG